MDHSQERAYKRPKLDDTQDDRPVRQNESSHCSEEYLRSFTSLSQLDGVISSLLTQVASLRTRRNELVAIATLPPEILVNIFALCESRDIHEHGYGSWPSSNYGLTRVCRAWRDLAFSTPLLWTYIYVRRDTSAADVYKFLDLSKSSSLDVYIQSPAPTIFTTLSEMHRIRTLSLTADASLDVNHISQPLTQSALLLEDARIDCLHLPEYLFNQQTPRLRNLSLKRCVVHRSTLVAPGVVEHLQHLSLHSCNFVEGTFLRSLRAALEQMSNLKALDVRTNSRGGDLAQLSDAAERDGTKTDVRRLEKLVLEGSLPYVLLILEHLFFSDTICLDLRFFSGDTPIFTLPFSHILAGHVLAGTGPSAAQHIVFNEHTDIVRRNQMKLCVSTGGQRPVTVSLTLWSDDSHPFHQDTLLHALCAPFHLVSLREVVVYSPASVEPSTFYRIFRESKRVASLTLIGVSVANAVRMLVHDPTENEACPTLFPALERLRLQGVYLTAILERSRSGQDGHPSRPETLLRILPDLLVTRRKGPSPPAPLRVELAGCRHVSIKKLRALSRAVGEAAEIVWDSDEYDESDSDSEDEV